jgi:hypothetical protein
VLTADDGDTIAKKLKAEVKKKAANHKIAIVKINGKEVGRFGIRRGSGDLDHNYIQRQLHMSMREAEEMAACRKDLAAYEAILRGNGYYPAD